MVKLIPEKDLKQDQILIMILQQSKTYYQKKGLALKMHGMLLSLSSMNFGSNGEGLKTRTKTKTINLIYKCIKDNSEHFI